MMFASSQARAGSTPCRARHSIPFFGTRIVRTDKFALLAIYQGSVLIEAPVADGCQ
jgi:hypothetical protein